MLGEKEHRKERLESATNQEKVRDSKQKVLLMATM